MCTSSMSIEYNQVWVDKNPQLFVESLNRWHQQTAEKGLEYRTVNLSRDGFVVYTAQAQETV